MMKCRCTFCKKEITDLRVKVSLETSLERNREDQTTEEIENSKILTHEFLCPECFEKFCDLLENGMKNV